ncbi:hypothetical protein R1flu_027318 [Riccia fluitans]|uniref:UBX domain-containing protein n=1 Tax=Riccia fluitans TaxID=41844 RepID=A0ABD1XIK4_9MARC
MDDKLKEKMEEVKSKGKDFFKKLGFSRSTPAFKGQGYTTGGSTQSRSVPDPVPVPVQSSYSIGKGSFCNNRPGSGVGNQQQGDWRKSQQEKWEREKGIAPPVQVPAQRCGTTAPSHNSSAHMHRGPAQTHGHVVESVNTLASAAASVKSPVGASIEVDTRESTGTVQVLNNDIRAPMKHSLTPDLLTGHGSHFDPYTPILSNRGSTSSSIQSFAGSTVSQSLPKVQCPVCQKFWNSEAEVSAHIDDCMGTSVSSGESNNNCTLGALEREQEGNMELDLDEAVATFLSGNPPASSLDTIQRLLGNVKLNPAEDKYRKIRLENPKVKEALVSSPGGLKVFLAVGFLLVVEGSEKVLLMGVPSDEQKLRIDATIAYITSYRSENKPSAPASAQTRAPAKIDRKLKIFLASSDHLEERFELPASFYELTAAEVKLEAEARRKKLEDSKMLMTRSSRDKLAAAGKRRYKATVLRVKLPDGVILQGYFGAHESTTALYEFVASTLNNPHENFDLVIPAATKHRVIPRYLEAGGQWLTLEEADLIPKALLKLKVQGDAPFTGLKSEYYGLCEQLSWTTLLEPVDFVQK